MKNQASDVRNAKPQEFRLPRRVAASFNKTVQRTGASRLAQMLIRHRCRLAPVADVSVRVKCEWSKPNRSPRGDDMKVAQGKRGTSAALGKRHKMIPSLFSNLVWRAWGAPNQIGKKRGWVWVAFYPGRRPQRPCPYMFSFVCVATFESSPLRVAFRWRPGLRCFTEASVASRSETAQPRAGVGFSANIFLLPLQFGECIGSSFCVFLPPQETETAAPAQGAAVVRASSPCPRTVFIHQSAAQHEPHVPSAPNSNRCQSVGFGRQLVFVRLS